MTKTISASEAKNRFGSVIGWAADQGDTVIVESHGEPKVVILPYAEYEKIQEMREQIRRTEVLARLERLAEKVRARNPDIETDEQAMAISDQFTRAAIDSLVKK